jgi:pimeloyl-ACP methyl ester carboxylesterase
MGRLSGGKPFTRGALYLMLQNRIYRGEIGHQGAAYPGQHEAIVDLELWRIVQEKLIANRHERALSAGADLRRRWRSDDAEPWIAGREDLWLRHFSSDWCYNPLAISGEAFETYVKAYRRPGAVRGAMDDYRANAEDVAQDMADADVKIACPTLALWGADYYAVGKLFDMLQVWAEMAGDLRTHAIPQCGHLPQEEQPEIVNRLLLDFLEGWIG